MTPISGNREYATVCDTVASTVHRMSAGAFNRELVRRFSPWWMWLIAGVALLTVVGGAFVSLRVSLAGFLLLLVILPPTLAIAYYSHALSRECFVNTTPHTVELRDGELVVSLYRRPDNKDEPTGENGFVHLHDEVFPVGCITSFGRDMSGMTLGLHDKHSGFLWIPNEAFTDVSDYDALADWARRCTGNAR